MTIAFPRLGAAAVILALAAGAGCKSTGTKSASMPGMAPNPKSKVYQPSAAQRAGGITQPWSDADVDFMTGMIPHHAQAVIMGGWAESHGARKDVLVLCQRIVNGQTDEIRMMQTWLGDRSLPVPDASDTRMHMKMNGMDHAMLMPGMLSDEEMSQLDKARGPDWDRLFLVGMIKHHQGAIDMVDALMKSYGAAQDDQIYKFASDVFADQSIEIERMNKMLADGGGSPR